MKMSETGTTVYERTYSRTKPDGSRETWNETVDRVVDGNLALADPRHQLSGERDDLVAMMREFKIIPAGRHLWRSGTQRSHLFNCWVSHWDEKLTDHFEFSFLRLMEGGGVGANYSNIYLNQYPEIEGCDVRHLVDDDGSMPASWYVQSYEVHIVCDPEHPDYRSMLDAGLLSTEYVADWSGCYEVDDTREGWAHALTDLLETYYRPAKNVNRVFDVSRVRSRGSRLKSSGGTASGPQPLALMLHEVAGIMNARIGSKLDGIGAMEIDHSIATCVVSGGNRRSARMSIMRWDDEQIFEFLACKSDTGKHWTTNISVEVDNHFFEQAALPWTTWAHDCLEKVAAGMLANGEPGIWNSELSNVGEPNPVVSTNPCLTGDTVIATLSGPRTFADLAEDGSDVEVYSWDPETKRPVVRWMRRPHKTRENTPILKVTFDSGLVVRCTPDHKFYSFRGKKVEAQDLKPGRSIRAFSASLDSSGHERVHGWDSKRNAADHQWTHRMIWENANGPIPDGMVVAHLDHDASNNDLSNLQVMTPYEHASYDYPLRKEAGFNGHCPNHKVVSVENSGFADVYNGMVEGSHAYVILDPEPIAGHMSGIISANCGEIALEPWEPCNLGHVNLAAFVGETGETDFRDLFKAHRLMTRFLIRATNADVNDPKSREVLDRNRRIGVGHLGVASYLALKGVRYSDAPSSTSFRSTLRILASVVEEEAVRYSHALRIPVPVKSRTVAPTGTIAKMPGVSEGIHPIFAKYFIRRIRFSDVDIDQRATVESYRARGYVVEPCQYAPNTTVVAIPTKDSLMAEVEARYGAAIAEDVVESAADVSLSDMLAFQAMYQEEWADNAVSYTVNVDADAYSVESLVGDLLNYGERLKGSTVFPEKSMPQSPYERLTRDEYEAYSTTEVADSLDEDCASGACPVR